ARNTVPRLPSVGTRRPWLLGGLVLSLGQRDQVGDQGSDDKRHRLSNSRVQLHAGQAERQPRHQTSNETGKDLAVRQPVHWLPFLWFNRLKLLGARYTESRAVKPVQGVFLGQTVDDFLNRSHYLPCISRVRQPPFGIR